MRDQNDVKAILGLKNEDLTGPNDVNDLKNLKILEDLNRPEDLDCLGTLREKTGNLEELKRPKALHSLKDQQNVRRLKDLDDVEEFTDLKNVKDLKDLRRFKGSRKYRECRRIQKT